MTQPTISVDGFVAHHENAMRVLERDEQGNVSVLAVEIYTNQSRFNGQDREDEEPFASYDFVIRSPGSAQAFMNNFEAGDPVKVDGNLHLKPVMSGGDAYINATIDNARWHFLQGIRRSTGNGGGRNDQFRSTEPAGASNGAGGNGGGTGAPSPQPSQRRQGGQQQRATARPTGQGGGQPQQGGQPQGGAPNQQPPRR